MLSLASEIPMVTEKLYSERISFFSVLQQAAIFLHSSSSGLSCLRMKAGAVGELGVQNALKMFAEELERVIENLVIVFFNVFAVLFAANVEVLNLEVIDIDNDGGVEFFTQIPAINFAALDDLLEALDVVEDNVLNKTVTVARLDFHVGNIFLRNQL